MQSQLGIIEFKKRLLKNTIIGNPDINGSPFVVFRIFNSSQKKFFGRVNDNSFEITNHQTFNSIPYKLKGQAIQIDNFTTKVEYIVKPIWFGYLWIKIISVFGILFFAWGIIAKPETRFPFVVFGIIWILLFIFTVNRSKRMLKKFEREFKITFLII